MFKILKCSGVQIMTELNDCFILMLISLLLLFLNLRKNVSMVFVKFCFWCCYSAFFLSLFLLFLFSKHWTAHKVHDTIMKIYLYDTEKLTTVLFLYD